MALAEVEFELTAEQFALMGYPALRQGQVLVLTLDAGVLAPDPAADGWYVVQAAPIAPQLVQIGAAGYAMAGQITDADIFKENDIQTGVVLINCGQASVRATLAPQPDGRLPWGAWETRYLTGLGRLQGIVEDDFHSAVAHPIGVTIWRFRRLVLAPGDPLFGQWHETVELPPAPFRYDRIYVTARIHRDRM